MSRKHYKIYAILKKLLLWISVVVIVVCICGPYVWMVATSLKDETEVYDISSLVPKNPISGLRNYLELFTEKKKSQTTPQVAKTALLTWIVNSLLVSGITAFLATALGAMGAYSFSRFRFLGRQMCWSLVMLNYLFPQSAVLIPFFLVWKWTGLLSTYRCLILSYLTFTLPLSTWLLTSFFNDIPRELDEAAKIDGCSVMGIFLRIIVPLSKHGLAAAAIFAFLACWSEYLFALIFMREESMKTITVGILSFRHMFGIQWSSLMAASVIASIPALILALFVQKTFAKGIMFGSLK